MNIKRVRKLHDAPEWSGPIVYWMDREQRVYDNWALYFAVQLAKQRKQVLHIIYNLDPNFLWGTLRQLDFKCKSLAEVEMQAHELGIYFHIVTGSETEKDIVAFVQKHSAGALVTDFSPLKIQRHWKEYVAANISVPLLEVDAHNIVPAWIISQKIEFQAATIRPKIHRALEEFLDELPARESYRLGDPITGKGIDFAEILTHAQTDRTVSPANWITPGPTAADAMLQDFIQDGLMKYDTLRNDPNADAQSNLSPYLHYGNISAQRIALEVQRSEASQAAKDVFLEELIVRREVAENYCFYCPDYDRFAGAWKWAQESLLAHWDDPREYVYSFEQFDQAHTHDTLWNAAQNELLRTGKIHGYMRMYWAKKILEWSKDPEEAIRIAITLNDRYELDGRDPNGYTGIMWSICGIHDRPWFDRPIFGKIRYMNRNGCEKKFDVDAYIAKWN